VSGGSALFYATMAVCFQHANTTILIPLVLDAGAGHDGLSLTTGRKYFVLHFLKHLFVRIGCLHVQRNLIMA